MALEILGCSVRSEWISMRPCVSSWKASSMDHLQRRRFTIVPQIWRSGVQEF